MTNPHSLSVRLLTRLRDMRIVWDVMGSLYNQRIYAVISDLYEYIAENLTTRETQHILEVGAGRGYVSVLLGSRNPQSRITGIDYSPMQVIKAEKYRRQKKMSNCSFQQNNAMSLPFNDSSFDTVVSVGSIKHWPDAYRGLQEIHRVLKPGGCLMISETDRGASDEDLRSFVQRFPIPLVPEWLNFWGLRYVIFGQSFTEEQLSQIVRQAGFTNIECRRVAACPYVIVKAWK